jgi:hypothetical protein
MMAEPTRVSAPAHQTGAPTNEPDLELALQRTAGPYRDAAQQYRDLGWQGVLPVGLEVDDAGVSRWLPRRKSGPPAGYTGYDGGWPDNRQVGQWVRRRGHCNIGLRVPDGLLGIDVDQYGQKRGLDNLVAYQRERGLPDLSLSDTIRSSARPWPSGIYWFRVPAGRRWRSEVCPGVEIVQYGHRYAVVWPSIHPEGMPYRWWCGDEEIAPPAYDDPRFRDGLG